MIDPDSNGPPTIDLARLAAGGDASALDDLIRRIRPYLKAVVAGEMRCTRDRPSVSDIVQNTCADIARNIDRFEGQQSRTWLVWLQRLAHGHVVDHLRREHAEMRDRDRRVPLGDLDVEGPRSRPSQRMLLDEEAVALTAALDRLAEDAPAESEAVRLKHLEGATWATIADLLGVTVKVARNLAHRGVGRLRHFLGTADS